MILRKLKPIRDRQKYSDDLQKVLAYDVYVSVFKPLFDILSLDVKQNAKTDILVVAFTSRKIYYHDGFVYGALNAAISKALRELGAKFQKSKRAYKIELGQFPQDIRGAIAKGATVEKDAIDAVKKKVHELVVVGKVTDTEPFAEATLADLHEQFKRVTPEDLAIPVEMDQFQREKMTQDYTESVDLHIKGLQQDAIERLRERVESEVGQGVRAEKLKDVLFAEYGIATNRAKMIARQETSLFVSKFRQVRYEGAGLRQYEWSSSNDERVRKDHRELNGQIFSWDAPPITNKHTGARNHPGADFGCRCVALPVFKVAGELVRV